MNPSAVLFVGRKPLFCSYRFSASPYIHCTRTVRLSAIRQYGSSSTNCGVNTETYYGDRNGSIGYKARHLQNGKASSKAPKFDKYKRSMHTRIVTSKSPASTQKLRRVTLLRNCVHSSAVEENISNDRAVPPTASTPITEDSTPRKPPSKFQMYVALGKARLTLGTAVMTACGYLAVGRFSPVEFTSVFLGSWILGMSGGAANQIIERNLDSQMARTKNRPLCSGQISLGQARAFAAGTGVLGTGLLLVGSNPVAASVGVATWVAYIVYTYSKTRTVFNTHIGAISGALPLVIGWTGAGGLLLDFQCLSAFAAMWLWQFSHFNVISWQYRQDYARAGFMMQSGIDMIKEKGRWGKGGLYAFTCAIIFGAIPIGSILHGYNSPLFLVSLGVSLPFASQMWKFWRDPVNSKGIKLWGRSFSALAFGGLTLLTYLIVFALSSTRWGEDGAKDFFGYSLSGLPMETVLFSRHCPMRLKMDNKRVAASHSSSGADPQFYSQEEMWRVYHFLSYLCPTYHHLPKHASIKVA